MFGSWRRWWRSFWLSVSRLFWGQCGVCGSALLDKMGNCRACAEGWRHMPHEPSRKELE